MANVSMQAAVLETFGSSFRITTVARPSPLPDQVLVRIAASAVNPLDLKIHAGEAGHARHPLPAILGIDMAGTVVATGPGVTGFRHGDEVYGMTGGVGGVQGSLAGYAAVDARLLAVKPTTLSSARQLPSRWPSSLRGKGWWTVPGSNLIKSFSSRVGLAVWDTSPSRSPWRPAPAHLRPGPHVTGR